MIEDRFAICSASCLHFNASLLHRLLCKTLYTKVAEKCRPNFSSVQTKSQRQIKKQERSFKLFT